jgi:uncharacterized protein YdhG (YjbR/CyaY superfamily)
MPTFYLHENLVHFAVYKNHIGFYPGPEAIEVYHHRLEGYTYSKGAIQFPLDKPLPLEIIQEIVRYRIKRAIEKNETKQDLKQKNK